jgi:hypothetical protein
VDEFYNKKLSTITDSLVARRLPRPSSATLSANPKAILAVDPRQATLFRRFEFRAELYREATLAFAGVRFVVSDVLVIFFR